ncbi:MAG: nucleotide disphospho-sugar-binding domain-containing protein [Burkholderia gladioli]
MSKMIITAIGSAGDVYPLLGVGRALADRGHHVVFCTHPQFEAPALRNGFAFVPIGTEREYADAMANPALWDPRTSFRTLWAVIAPSLRPHFDKLSELIDDDTVLVGTLWAFSARLLQERDGARYVSVQVSPSTLLSAHAPPTHKRLTIPRWLPLWFKSGLMTLIERRVLDQVCGPQLNALRAELGLPPARRILGRWLHSSDGVLCLFPAWFAAPQPDWPANHRLAGFPLFNDIDADAPDPELDAFLDTGAPPVVFTAGSTRVDGAGFADAVGAAMRATGVRGILITPDTARRDGEPDASHLIKRRYVPLRQLLPRARALVHHGGIGTASLAYEAGLPQVVMPSAHDQFDNAQRVADSGCGVRLDAPVDGAELSAALARVLADTAMAERCATVRAEMAGAADGCVLAARLIEDCAAPAAGRSAAGRAAPAAGLAASQAFRA